MNIISLSNEEKAIMNSFGKSKEEIYVSKSPAIVELFKQWLRHHDYDYENLGKNLIALNIDTNKYLCSISCHAERKSNSSFTIGKETAEELKGNYDEQWIAILVFIKEKHIVKVTVCEKPNENDFLKKRLIENRIVYQCSFKKAINQMLFEEWYIQSEKRGINV